MNNNQTQTTVKTLTANNWVMAKFNQSYQPVAYKNFVAYRLFIRKINNRWLAVPSFTVNCPERIDLLDTFEITTEDAKTFLESCKTPEGNRIGLIASQEAALNKALGLN